MADSGAAQNKLGELFVDIGVGGLGKTLKALNSVSASFLMTKNAAVGIAQPLLSIGKVAMSSAVDIGKLSASFGTTLIEAQKLSYYLKEKNLSSGLLSNLSAVQDQLTRAKMGYGSLDGQMQMSLNRLGIDWLKYDGSADSMLEFVKDVQTAIATQGLSVQEAKMHLQNLKLSDPDWIYAFQRGDFNLNEAKTAISDAQIQAAIEGQEAWNKLLNNLSQAGLKMTAKVLEGGGTNALNRTGNVVMDALDENSNISKDINSFGLTGKTLKENFTNPETIIKNLINTNPIFTSVKSGKLIKDLYDSYNKNDKLNYNLPDPMNANPNTVSYDINITNQNNITGNNADEIADKIASINSQDIQLTQFQVHNMAGV
jgi:hypothetical protein